MSKLEHIAPEGLLNVPTYTHVVTSQGQRTIYISGQVALTGDGQLVGAGDVGAQTEQVMKNLQVALAAAGATFADVVKITTFVVDYSPEHRAAVSDARSKYLRSPPPASTLVGVASLAAPEFLVEIEAIAVVD